MIAATAALQLPAPTSARTEHRLRSAEASEDQTDEQVSTVICRHAFDFTTVQEEATNLRQPDDSGGSAPPVPADDFGVAVRRNAREIRNLREDVLSLHRITSDLIWVTKLEEKAREAAVSGLEDRLSRERTAHVIMLNCLDQKQDCLENATKRWVQALGRDCLGTREHLGALDAALEALSKSSIAAKEQLMRIDASGGHTCSEMARSETVSQLDGLDGEMAQLRESLGRNDNASGGEEVVPALQNLASTVEEMRSRLDRVEQQDGSLVSKMNSERDASEQHRAAIERRIAEDFYCKRDIDSRFAQVWWRLNEAKKVRLTQSIQTQNTGTAVGSGVFRRHPAAMTAVPTATLEEPPLETVQQQRQPPMPTQHRRPASTQRFQPSALPEGMP